MLRFPILCTWQYCVWAIVITAAALVQGILIYHRVFDAWEGPIGTHGKESLLPAIFIAAGRGFAVADVDSIPGLRSFLTYGSREFDISSLPDDVILEYPDLHFQWHRYVQYTVGWIWRICGASWHAVAGLILVMLFVSCAAVYGISRQALSVPWSIFVVEAFLWNASLSSTMPLFRDFSKAPFILTAIYLLARAVRRELSWKGCLGHAALIGLVLGVGMGFRRDMAAIAPLAAFILCTCRIKPVRFGFVLRPAAILLLGAVFVVTAFPVLKSFYPVRWTNNHDLIMGLSSRCDQELGTLTPASYEKHYLSHDIYTVYMFWAAVHHGTSMEGTTQQAALHGEASMSEITGAYLMTAVRLFPSDFISRAYAAVLRCVTGIRSSSVPFASIAESFSFVFVIASLLFVASADFRLAWQILLLLLLFCGSTSLQFGMRHSFHLSFLPYWFGCLAVSHAIRWIRERRRKGTSFPGGRVCLRAVRRPAVWLLITFALLYAPLVAARRVQYGQVENMLQCYTRAERAPLNSTVVSQWSGETLMAPGGGSSCLPCDESASSPWHRQRVIVARFRESPNPLDLKLVYEWSNGGLNFSGPIWSHTRPGTPTGDLEVYFSVFETTVCGDWNRFAGLLMPERQAKLFVGFEEVKDPDTLPFYVNVTVPEHKEAFVYCQGLRVPWPWQQPIQYPWPMEAYLNQNDAGIRRCLTDGDSDTAVELAASALSERPGSMHFRALLTEAYFQAGRSEDAWRVIEEMLAEHPGEDSLYHLLDLLFSEMGTAEDELRAWQRIAGEHPGVDCVQAYLVRAADRANGR